MRNLYSALALPVFLVTLSACTDNRRSLEVVATAYTSHAAQTNSQPSIAAWGDKLDPDKQSIDVSRDLLALGLGRGVEVEIEGLPGKWTVLDKMNAGWKKKIDLYMGKDIKAAREWGKRTVTIRWED